MENVNTVCLDKTWEKSFLGRQNANVSAYSIFVKGEGRKEESRLDFQPRVSRITDVKRFFGRRGVYGGTKFRAHA